MKAKLIAIALVCMLLAVSCWRNGGSDRSIEIHDIQGCAHISPLEGQYVRDVDGIVTKKYSNGFVIESDQPDGLDCSSEALYIHTNEYVEVLVGQRVAVSGTVAEFTPGTLEQNNLSQTEITHARVKVISSSSSWVEPVVLGKEGRVFPEKIVEDDAMRIFDPETDGLDFYESLEFMLVELPEMVVVGPRNDYNEIVVVEAGSDQRDSASPQAAVMSEEDRRPDRIMIALPDNWKTKVNVGDTLVSGMEGVLIYDYGNYKLDPISEVNIEEGQNESKMFYCADSFSNELRVANYNLRNFSQYSSSSRIKSLAIQIANDICAPDLLVLEEVEDDSGEKDDAVINADVNLEMLIAAIGSAGGPEYEYFDFPSENNSSGGINGGNIRTVFLLRKDSKLKIAGSSGRLTKNGGVEVGYSGHITIKPNPMLIGWDDPSFENSRKPAVGLFSFGERQVLVIGLHLISKSANSPEYGRIQPPAEPELQVRIAQAAYVNHWIAQVLSQSPDTLVIVAGDMNDEYASEVLKTLQREMLIDTAADINPADRYSILMDGGASLFDHILVSQNISEFTAKISHLNTPLDESSQVSDHDPIVATIVINK